MKITKWLLLAALAFLCCACSKNNPLAYVDEDADKILYFNLTDEIDSDIWDVFLKNKFRELDMNSENELLGVDLKKNPSKIAHWVRYPRSKDEKRICKTVIVFQEYEAKKFLDKASEYYKDKYKSQGGEAEDTKIDDCPAIICKRKEYYSDKKIIDMTIIASGDHIVQIIQSDKDVSEVLKPDGKCDLAKKINDDAVHAEAISADYQRHRQQEKADDLKKRKEQGYPLSASEKNFKVLNVGDKIKHNYIKGDELVSEQTIDTDELDD